MYYEASKLGAYDQGENGYGYFERIWSDGATVRTIYIGLGLNNGHRSACHQRVLDRDRNPTSYFWCHIMLDLKRDVLANLDLTSSIRTEVVKQDPPKVKVPNKQEPKKITLDPKP